MAEEIIKVIEYLASNPLLIGLAIGGAVFFVIVLVFVIAVFAKTFSRMRKFDKHFDRLNSRKRF